MLIQLVPEPVQRVPLAGAYLALGLHRQAGPGDILIYANYLASVDGRIALCDPSTGEFGVPAAIANDRDWRLYQELAAQAGVMIISARYMRQLATGTAQDLLPVGEDPRYRDLKDWRTEQGLKPQPDVVIVSRSLDIPVAALARLAERRIIVATTTDADTSMVEALRKQGIEVLTAGQQHVEGQALRQALAQMGYRSAYMIAGPEVHRMLLAEGALDRLFLTTRHCLLGGKEFHTILGQELPAPVTLKLNAMYLDAEGGQHFADYRIEGSHA
jgi:riboflavin biosynthesis pyrimidine reductase